MVKTMLSTISGFFISLANTASITGCTVLFHEVEIPEKLKKEIKF
ncbi:MAG: cyclic lactone autoinducer peptide [Lysinibacillus sp.]|nr:cyclic lactone autoinducer peptide [Lysinibacillus sp.]